MLDRNNINRVRGILSAKNGAEIPKFQNPAGPLPKPFYIKDDKYFLDNKEVTKELFFQDTRVQQAYGDHLNQALQSQTVSSTPAVTGNPVPENTGSLNGTGVQTTIPGGNNINPNAAVEAAAKANAQVAAELEAKRAAENAKAVEEAAAKVRQVADVTSVGRNEIGDGSGDKELSSDDKKTNRKAKWEQFGMQALQESVNAFNSIGAAVGAQQAATDSNTTKIVNTAYDSVAGLAENFGPVGQVVGAAMKNASIAGDIIQSLGGGTDQQTATDKWMDSSFFSWNIGMINGFFGKESDKFSADQDILSRIGSSYGGTTYDINDAASRAGKKYGLFSSGARNKANQDIAEARSKQNLMGNIADRADMQRLSVASMGEQAGLAYSMLTDGGYNQKYTYAAKHGGSLEWNPVIELEWQPQVELNWDLHILKEGGTIDLTEELEWIPEFQKGGKTEELETPEIEETTQKNVIPEGALHKNKHHMDHAEGLTKKGIPVIDEDGEQQAEIELNEIIFTLEVTKQLEEYYNIFYSEESTNKEKEQAALDAGKLLVYQILENTEDRTGLIESCKKGGTLQLKKSTDDLIEEVLDQMPTLVVVEEVVEEIKEKEEENPKKKSEKEQMKEAIKEVLIELLTK